MKAWHGFSAAGLPVGPVLLPEAAHCVLGQRDFVKPMISFSYFPFPRPILDNKSCSQDGTEEAEMKPFGDVSNGLKGIVMRKAAPL